MDDQQATPPVGDDQPKPEGEEATPETPEAPAVPEEGEKKTRRNSSRWGSTSGINNVNILVKYLILQKTRVN
ncbi:MAG: hypothetical protein ABH837_00110 [bacterium]